MGVACRTKTHWLLALGWELWVYTGHNALFHLCSEISLANKPCGGKRGSGEGGADFPSRVTSVPRGGRLESEIGHVLFQLSPIELREYIEACRTPAGHEELKCWWGQIRVVSAGMTGVHTGQVAKCAHRRSWTNQICSAVVTNRLSSSVV